MSLSHYSPQMSLRQFPDQKQTRRKASTLRPGSKEDKYGQKKEKLGENSIGQSDRSIVDTRGDIYIICLALDSHPEALNCAITAPYIPTFPLHTAPPPDSSALPFPPEEPETIQQGTPVPGLVPAVSLMPAVSSLWHLTKASRSALVVPQAAFFGVKTFQHVLLCSQHL